ncbi:flagellin [Oceanospirillaceae bacterium]|jgi:flagellin|nr:flagellin [Oceanospirillaceae bacterium]
MAMVINTNTASLTTQRHLSSSRGEMEVAMERMSSGSRVNSSMDDAAGLAIGNRMTSQVEGLNQAVRNANDGISLAQTAEGALGSSQNILQRMRVLAVQAANDTYSSVDRKAINNEIVQLKEELNRGVNQASFNGNKILNGTNASFTFQVGHMSGDNVVVTLGDMRGSMIGTQSWDPKASTTAPVTVAAVAGITTAVLEVDTYTVSGSVASGGSASFTYDGTTYSAAFDTDAATTIAALATAINAGAAGSTVTAAGTGATTFTITADVGSATQMTAGTIGGTTNGSAALTLTSKAETTVGVGLRAEQESYDYSAITLVSGDRVSLTIGTKTYIQEFTTNQASTLSALGALVVNGEATYAAKTVDADGKLVFTGAAAGTAMAAATAAVESSSVSEANSVDDILVTDTTSAKAALAVIDSALDMMSDFRAMLGAASNRMFITVDNLMSMSENTGAARSRIIDADFAAESASLAKSQVLQKAGTAMLSQANASTQDILSLLK